MFNRQNCLKGGLVKLVHTMRTPPDRKVYISSFLFSQLFDFYHPSFHSFFVLFIFTMVNPNAALLLLTLQFLTSSVLASPASYPHALEKHGSGQSKRQNGLLCVHNDSCISGVCRNNMCLSACKDTSKCGDNEYCDDRQVCVSRKIDGSECTSDEACLTNSCINSKCQAIQKRVGEACDTDKYIFCDLGAVCEKKVCRAIGSEPFFEILSKNLLNDTQKPNIVTDFHCSSNLNLCSSAFAYCDYKAEVCRHKLHEGGYCQCINGTREDFNLNERCASDRCTAYGYCGTKEPGQKGDPCSRDDECKENGLICRKSSNPYNPSHSMKVCNVKKEHGIGQRCKKTQDCKSYNNYCYDGECSGIREVQGKSCNIDDDCGGIVRRKHETAYQMVGFRCEKKKCVYYNYADGSTGIEGLLGSIFGDPNKHSPS